MSLLVVGDVSLHDWRPREVLALPEVDGARVVFNLESPAGNSFRRASGPALGASIEALDALRHWTGSVAALANNHLLDAGDEGAATIEALARMNIQWLGARGRSFVDLQDEGRPMRVFNWVTAETTPGPASAAGPCHFPGLSQAMLEIREAKARGLSVLVYLHWGLELFPYPTPEDRQRAHALARAGADAIIGAHPHVIRGVEWVGKTPVLYSLGNYHFGDMYDECGQLIVKQVKRTRLAMAARLTCGADGSVDVKLTSYRRGSRGPERDFHETAKNMLERLSVPLELPLERYADWYARWVRRRFPLFRLWHFRRHEVSIRDWPRAAYRIGVRKGRALLK